MINSSRTALSSALMLLNRREYSQRELLQKLKQKGYAEDEAQAVITELSQKDIQSDKRALRSLIASGVYNKHGPKRILLNALNKGFLQEDIEEEISRRQEQHVDAEISLWEEQAKHLIERSFGAGPYDYPTQTKIVRRLLGRGYDYDLAQRLAKNQGPE